MVQKIKFQWYFDFSTSAESMQIITVSAGGQDVFKRLKPFFGAYKYYRLGNVSCSLVPASTLPVDPTGLSYVAGDNLVDPRDQLNPGLTRITNGEDFIDDISRFSEEQLEHIYETMVVDTRWYKWSLQSGLKRKAYPKYWQIGQLHQDYFPGATTNVPGITAESGVVVNRTDVIQQFDISAPAVPYRGTGSGYIIPGESDPRGIFQTGHKGRLGWMPTDSLIHFANANGEFDNMAVAPIPTIELFKIVTPKAHKTVYYYRCYCTETVYFSGPITSASLYQNMYGQIGLNYPMLDRFISSDTQPSFSIPGYGRAQPNPPNEGGDE